MRRFVSEPPGAWVYVNGERVGQTPCDVHVDFGRFPATWIQIFTEGREPWETRYVLETFTAIGKEQQCDLKREAL